MDSVQRCRGGTTLGVTNLNRAQGVARPDPMPCRCCGTPKSRFTMPRLTLKSRHTSLQADDPPPGTAGPVTGGQFFFRLPALPILSRLPLQLGKAIGQVVDQGAHRRQQAVAGGEDGDSSRRTRSACRTAARSTPGQPRFRRRGEGHEPHAAVRRHHRLHGLPEHRRGGRRLSGVRDRRRVGNVLEDGAGDHPRPNCAGRVVPMDTAAVASELQKTGTAMMRSSGPGSTR